MKQILKVLEILIIGDYITVTFLMMLEIMKKKLSKI